MTEVNYPTVSGKEFYEFLEDFGHAKRVPAQIWGVLCRTSSDISPDNYWNRYRPSINAAPIYFTLFPEGTPAAQGSVDVMEAELDVYELSVLLDALPPDGGTYNTDYWLKGLGKQGYSILSDFVELWTTEIDHEASV